MNHPTAVCPPSLLPTQTPLLQRWAARMLEAWNAWRTQSRLDNELRALQALSDSTLRDIGLAERVLPQSTLSTMDYERGRW